MKAVLHYRATPGFRRQIAALGTEWLHIAVVDETDSDSSRGKWMMPTCCFTCSRR